MRTIGVVTTTRADYSSCRPLLHAIQNEPGLALALFVGGMHLAPAFGLTVRDIEADGFTVDERIEMLLASDTPEGVAKSIGLGTIGFAQSFARLPPDLLVMVGDRLELLAAASAALACGIPIAHLSGGDLTEGAVDNQVRHAISKMSHLHFVAMPAHAARLLQMGEEPWRIVVSGDPALDLLHEVPLLSREDLSAALGIALEPPVLLITYHPTTLGSGSVAAEIDALMAALQPMEGTFIITYPNADADAHIIIERIEHLAATRPHTVLVASLGQVRYYSLLAQADVMVGNSSSGIWEAPTFRLPVVNIGERQRGRLRAGNVIDVVPEAEAIARAIQQALTPAFRASLQQMTNPYGDGHAAARIVERLKQVPLDTHLLRKQFYARAPSETEDSTTPLPGPAGV